MKILSISCEQDAGAAINIDGQIVAAVNEERLNRKKLYIGFPKLSIHAVCSIANLEVNDFDYISISTFNHIASLDYSNVLLHQKLGELLSKVKPIQLALNTNLFTQFVKEAHKLIQTPYRSKIIKQLRGMGFQQKIFFVDHHTCHASAAYFTSGWKDALTITLDGAGDGVCSRVFTSQSNTLREVHNIPFYNSPGYYYSYATNVCGFKYGREGKLTGLAAFGNPAIAKQIFESRINYISEKLEFINYGHYFNSEINFLREALDSINKEDIAAGIQLHTEEMVTKYINDLLIKFNKNKPAKLALCGGVFANVKLNQKISELDLVDKVYVHPHMGDGGLAVGASFALLMKLGFQVAPYDIDNAYLGTKYEHDELIKSLKLKGVNFTEAANPSLEIAKGIAEGKVVAHFNGKMEYGPRALGNRSIFVSAKDPSINNSLNNKLQRSEFMPFSPIITKEKEDKYFTNLNSKHKCTRFMTIATEVTRQAISDIPAAVHVDNTARFQSITQKQNPTIHEMLKIHETLTGVPAVINTSFNMHEEPIVESPTDAIDCFLKGHLDMLVLGNYVLSKEKQKLKVVEINSRHTQSEDSQKPKAHI